MSQNDKVLFEEIEEDCKKVISKHVNSFLKDKSFNLKDTDFMINYLNDKILNELKNISLNFKYILSLALIHSESNGFTQDVSLYLDKETDGGICEKYSFENIVCVVNLFLEVFSLVLSTTVLDSVTSEFDNGNIFGSLFLLTFNIDFLFCIFCSNSECILYFLCDI